MNFYAIRKKNTNAFLPAGRGKGFTHDEPREHVPPRLFLKPQHAEAALRWWSAGESYTSWRLKGSFVDADYAPEIETRKVEGRRKEDMEVVEVILKVENTL